MLSKKTFDAICQIEKDLQDEKDRGYETLKLSLEYSRFARESCISLIPNKDLSGHEQLKLVARQTEMDKRAEQFKDILTPYCSKVVKKLSMPSLGFHLYLDFVKEPESNYVCLSFSLRGLIGEDPKLFNRWYHASAFRPQRLQDNLFRDLTTLSQFSNQKVSPFSLMGYKHNDTTTPRVHNSIGQNRDDAKRRLEFAYPGITLSWTNPYDLMSVAET